MVNGPIGGRVASAFALLLVVGATSLGFGQVAPVVRDPSINAVAYTSFSNPSNEAIWQTVNGLEFWAIPLAAPADYYNGVNANSATRLRDSLHELIRNHRVFPYTHRSRPGDSEHAVDTWDIIALADAHPEMPSAVLDVYMNATFPRQLSGPQGGFKYDREHSWPKSLGFSEDSITNPPYSDCHHLFAAYSSYNGSRSNKPYGDADPAPEARRTTVENTGRGGAINVDADSSNFSYSDVWQTWLGRRGDVARAMMYMDIRYEGTYAGGNVEPDLRLTDDIAQIQSINAIDDGIAHMGLKATLLRWHEQDPVDDLERRRNTVVYLFQGNRNPFIDHPEWVSIVYGTAPTTTSTTVDPWINEFHYDNVGEDVGEFVEIAGPAGLNLNGWKVLGYNGTGGKLYHTIELAGIIPNLQHGIGVLAFDFPKMQNGPDDGLALIAPDGRVVEVLSYEGRMTATDGLADGADSTPIDVAETGDTTTGHSLQLHGTGRNRPTFTWDGPKQATRGSLNSGQNIIP